jgi:hypothetical protein
MEFFIPQLLNHAPLWKSGKLPEELAGDFSK